jgi:hypothetical protein
VPSARSIIRYEFEYPSYWVFFDEEKNQYVSRYSIEMVDPIFRTIPTRAPDESHGTPSDFGRVSFIVQPASKDFNLSDKISTFKEVNSGLTWIKELDDYQVLIDGIDAKVLEYQIEPISDNNGFSSLMFERVVFFEVNDQYYQIVFIVAESERGGQFEQGFDHFFKSLKYVPTN